MDQQVLAGPPHQVANDANNLIKKGWSVNPHSIRLEATGSGSWYTILVMEKGKGDTAIRSREERPMGQQEQPTNLNQALQAMPEGQAIRWTKFPTGLTQVRIVQAYDCRCTAAQYLEAEATLTKEEVDQAKYAIREHIEAQLQAGIRQQAGEICLKCRTPMIIPEAEEQA